MNLNQYVHILGVFKDLKDGYDNGCVGINYLYSVYLLASAFQLYGPLLQMK